MHDGTENNFEDTFENNNIVLDGETTRFIYVVLLLLVFVIISYLYVLSKINFEFTTENCFFFS